ncbi:MAG: LPXTG cell wall anchor domain-containing protein, partial [Hornefia butyriciproducens]|nr:LPXTG cell wall anchor domain-containing protein [Hornefia butyriciproducens]
QRVTIVMGLKKEYTKFSDLYRDVTGVSDTLDMKVPGVKIPADTKDGTKLKVTGEVTGTFTGEATSEAGTLKAFNYRWKAEQTEEGRDFVIQDPDNKTIQYTISVVKKAADKPDTPDKPDKPNKPDKPDKPTNLENKKDEEGMGPLTGDQTSVLLWGGTALLAVLAAAGLILKRRRRS